MSGVQFSELVGYFDYKKFKFILGSLLQWYKEVTLKQDSD